MITNRDLRIENISYTNKDFAQVYPELIDQVKELTDKWDPELTNESDPGVVLLKIAAFVADKTNYNIDKAILEQFPTSVTQESNARKIYDMLGYNMKYYRSATTKISFKYLGGNSDLDALLDSDTYGGFTFKAFDTTVKTEDDITYTLLEDIDITKDNPQKTLIDAIQGRITCLNVSNISDDDINNNSIKIQLYNLDDNNRVYFPDRYVAENGIFINKIYSNLDNSNYWKRVDNLNDMDLGVRRYKFGFDSSKGLPYIEFPEDIANLIDDGLEIWYIITDGLAGYAKNGTLTELSNYKIVNSNNEVQNIGNIDPEMYILTNSEAIGARDPETLDEAFINFKKTVGTFNTLLSRRDYANGIYNAADSEGNHLVSAVQVGDKRTDPNVSVPVLVRDENGVSYTDYKQTDASRTVDPNTIFVHATKPVLTTITTKSSYDTTYNLISEADLRNIDNAIYENKTLVHTLSLPQAGTASTADISFIENLYKLKVNLTTTYKVNSYEETLIIGNIKKALYNAFNARRLDFGEEIPYEKIVDVIQNADTRIKYVFVENPVITPTIVYQDNNDKVVNVTYDPTSTSRPHINILTNNILAGRIPYYEDKEQFTFNFTDDSSVSHVTPKLKNIDAYFTISANTSSYPLKENETLQVIEDSFIANKTYPAYIYYNFQSENQDIITDGIPNDTVYQLTGNDKLYIYYTNNEDVKVFEVYTAGDFIRPGGFETTFKPVVGGVAAGENTSPSRWVDFTNKKVSREAVAGYTPMYALGTNEQIEDVIRNETILKDKTQKIFWYVKPTLTNTDGDLVFTNGEYILEEGEFFIYPNDDMTSICVLSAGTKIIYAGGTIEKPVNIYIDTAKLSESIDTEDLGVFEKSFDWVTIDLSTNNLTLRETVNTNFLAGDIVNIDSALTSVITNTWKSVPVDTEIRLNDRSIVCVSTNCNNMKVRTVLSIVGSKEHPQKVEGTQFITITDYNDASVAISASLPVDTLQVYPAIDTYNSVFLATPKVVEEDGVYVITGEYEYPYSSYVSKETTPASGTLAKLVEDLPKNARDEYIYTTASATSVTLGTSRKVTVFDKVTKETAIYDNPSDVINFAAGSYLISTPRDLEINEDIPAAVRSTIETKLANLDFDYLTALNPAKQIEAYDIFTANWFFDKNNLYNDYVIAKLDFDNSEFRIVGASKK